MTPRTKDKATLSATSPHITRLSPRGAIRRPRFGDESGSDIEKEYGRGTPSGKLVIANAVVEPSSSDSEASESRRPGPGQSKLRTPRDLRSGLLEKIGGSHVRSSKYSPAPEHVSARQSPGFRAAAVGLGFRFDNDQYPPQSNAQGMDTDDDRSVYDDTDNEQDAAYPQREAYPNTAGHHHVEYTEGHSAYEDVDEVHESDHRTAHNTHHKARESSRSAANQTQALASLIDGMQAEFGFPPQPNRLSHSDSEQQCLVEGIAVSGSQEHEPECQHDEFGERGRAKHIDVHEMRKRYSSRSRSRHEQVTLASMAPPTTSADSNIVSATPRRSSRRRDSRSSSVPHMERSVSRQESTSYRQMPTDDRETQRPYVGTKPLDLTSRHRLSASLGQLNERYHDPGNLSQPDIRRNDMSNRRDSVRITGGGRDSGNRSSDLIVREREAFGIPASLSYNGVGDSPDSANGEPDDVRRSEYIRSESENSLSSVEELCRVGRTISTPDEVPNQEVNGGLSSCAEALFRNLSTRSHGSRQERRQSRRNSSSNDTKSPKTSRRRSCSIPQLRDVRHSPSQIANPWSPPQQHEHPSVDSRSRSATSHMRSSGPWRARMNPSTYKTLLSKHGPTEMQRQELLYEQFLSQQELVARLRSIVKIFILPLRRKHSKSWIPGVPTLVTRLFDWLEDIVNLHTTMYDALHTASRAWDSGIVIHVAETLRGFVPKFEIYQPYLVRLDEVRDLLTEHAADAHEEFREFVKLRERHVECGGWTLVDLLLQPLVRLCEFTPVFKVRPIFQCKVAAHENAEVVVPHATGSP